MNVIRMNLPWEGKTQEEIDTFQEMKGSCDEVWLGLWGYYPEEELARMEKNYARTIEHLKEAGIRYVFEMGANLGHSSEDTESPVTESFRNMVDFYGRSFHGTYCPRCENLRAYQHRVITRYAKYKPYAVMIDDDTRLEFHGHLNYGCFCDVCIGLFNERYGYSLTRDEIRRKFLTDTDFRRQYVEFDRDSLADYVAFIASEVKAVSPDSRMGFENVLLGGFHGGNHTHIWEALHRVSGKEVIARSGCGTYTDDKPRDTLTKMLMIHYQNSQLPDYVTTRRPEIENLVMICMGKSARGTMMEAELNLALGCNGTSFHTLCADGEPLSYEKRCFRALRDERAYFEAIRAWNATGKTVGLHPVLFEDAYAVQKIPMEEVLEGEQRMRDFNFWGSVPYSAGWGIWATGMPLSFDDDAAYLLHPDMVPYLTDAEIEELLSKNVLTDGAALAALCARGYGKDIPANVVECALPSEDIYDRCQHPITEGLGIGYLSFIGAASAMHGLIPAEGAVEDGRLIPLAYGGEKITAALLKTGRGGTWGVYSNRLFNSSINNERRLFTQNLAAALAGGLSARLLSPEQAVVIPRKNTAGNCTGAFIFNVSISDTEELILEVDSPAGTSFNWVALDGKRTPCAYEEKDGHYHVHTPAIPGYKSGLLLCE